MGKFPKRQVRAQRKFAQGAYIPPSTVQPERRPDPPTISINDDLKFSTNLTAKDLLNHVALHKIHSKSKPIVLLKRLPKSQELNVSVRCNQDINLETNTVSKPTAQAAAVRNQTPTTKTAKTTTIRKQTHQKLRMNLRSQILTRSSKNNEINIKDKKHLLRKSKTISKRRDSSAEDNTPLQYLVREKNKKKVLTRKALPLKPTHTSSVHTLTQSLKRKQAISKRARKQSMLSINSSKVNSKQKERLLKKRMINNGETIRPPSPRDTFMDVGSHTPQLENDDSHLDIIIGSFEKNLRTPPSEDTCDVEGTPASTTDIYTDDTVSSNAGILTKTHQFKINSLAFVTEWLKNAYPNEATPEFKVPQPPKLKTSPTKTQSKNELEIRTKCPSWLYSSIGAMAKTSPEVLEQFCGDCARCLMLHKVIKLAKHIPSLKSSNIGKSSDSEQSSDDWCIMDLPESASVMNEQKSKRSDIYDFNFETEGPITSFRPLRTRSTESQSNMEISDPSLQCLNKKHVINITEVKEDDYEAAIVLKDNEQVPLDLTKEENRPKLEKAIKHLLTIIGKTTTTNAQDTGDTTQNSQSEQSQPSTSRSASKKQQNNTAKDKQKNKTSKKTKQVSNKDLDEDKGVQANMKILEAPTYYPTNEEMSMDFIKYIEKIEPEASKYGICKIKPPPDFKTPYVMKNVQFKINNQYISTMFKRWGNASKEMTAIKAHLATQNVPFTRPPLFNGIEVDLVKLYHEVQKHGGLRSVIEHKKWGRIADSLKMSSDRIKAHLKLDKLYCKHLLPYDTLTNSEREDLLKKVDIMWQNRFKRMCERAAKPLHRKRRLLGESDSSEDEPDQESERLAVAFVETEDCVVPGRRLNYSRFTSVAEEVQRMHCPVGVETPQAIEREYWQRVLRGDEHVCVYSASLDTSAEGLGFPPEGAHPWNLKRLGESAANVLSALGPTLAVTVPTLHLAMMFSTNCWHMDPHHLPWTEYMHEGPDKIWYGIPEAEGSTFRAAVEQLCPTAVQNKSIWLPSDITMIPPDLLVKRGVSLSRLQQSPGEYVIVFPRAYSCSISTGTSLSESLYFASEEWLDRVEEVFLELRSNCEPAMFSLEQLAIGLWRGRNPGRARYLLEPMLLEEISNRSEAAARRLPMLSPRALLAHNRRLNDASWQIKRDECDVCRTTLYFSKMIGVSTARTSVCLPHGLQMYKQKQTRSEEILCILFINDDEIDEMLKSIKSTAS